MDRHYYERMQEKLDQLKEAGRPEPIRSDGAGALDLGPRDITRDGQNPDMLVPPATDHGLLPNLRFSFADTHMVIKPGGSSRFVISRDQPPGLMFMCVSEKENRRLGMSPWSVAGGTSMSGFSSSRRRSRGPKSSAPAPSLRMGSGRFASLS